MQTNYSLVLVDFAFETGLFCVTKGFYCDSFFLGCESNVLLESETGHNGCNLRWYVTCNWDDFGLQHVPVPFLGKTNDIDFNVK